MAQKSKKNNLQNFFLQITLLSCGFVSAGDSKVTVTSKTDAEKELVTEVGNGAVTVNVKDGATISTPLASPATEVKPQQSE